MIWENIPVVDRHSLGRTYQTVPFAALHEFVYNDVQNDSSMIGTIAERTWPAVYHQHPVTLDARANGQADPLPLALFIGGVRYSSNVAGRADSISGVWLINLMTSKRYYFGCLRELE
eukprot:6620507-Pyramimonas_sp.AAC.1